MKLITTWGFELARQFNRKLSIRKKVVLSYVFLILLPACTLMYLYYTRSTTIIEGEVTNAILQALKQAEINISYRMDNVRDISNSIFMNSNLHTYISRNEESDTIERQIEDAKELGKILLSVQNNMNVFRIRLFVNSNKIYSGEGVNFFSLKDAGKEDWYDPAISENGRIYWAGTYKEQYINDEEAYVFSAVRMIKHPVSYDLLAGILAIDIPEESLYSILSGINLSNKESIYMIDLNGNVISHFDKSKIGSKILDDPTLNIINNTEEGIEKISAEDSFLIHKKLRATNWKIIAQVPAKEITRRNTAFYNASGFITVVITLIIFILAVFLILTFLAEGMSKRIKRLVGIMKKEGVEGLGDEIASRDGDIYRLEKNVDTMIKTLKNLMEESYRAKMQEREAQLKALQAQINPHFLYNTLDTINWMAIRRNADDISFMLDSLAKYFRLSLNKGQDIVSIADEINLARVYLEIQKKRFPDNFEVWFEIEEKVNQQYIPKLTLQPVIENALLHGIQKKADRKGTIGIEAKMIENDILIVVSDDGVGIDSNRIDALLSATPDSEKADSQGSSYGLYNVNERLKLFSGEAYGIRIYSEVGRGTKVEIKFKAGLRFMSTGKPG